MNDDKRCGTWMDISTAPRDGTVIIACGQYEGRTDTAVHPRSVRWQVYHPNAKGVGAWRNYLGHKENFLTHWMPCPAPPCYERKERDEREATD